MEFAFVYLVGIIDQSQRVFIFDKSFIISTIIITKIIIYRYFTFHSNKMMQPASLISTLAVTVFLSFLPAINRTTYNAYGFSFDHPAPYSPSMSSDRVRVVGIHRPGPQQLQDQQQQQQRPMMIRYCYRLSWTIPSNKTTMC